jgi:metal-responsive CopG/Arc/MetJ family transcriptional regulator
MKTAISIPDPLFHNAERVAHRLRMSRSRFFASAVSRYVHEVERNDVTERLNTAYKDADKQSPALPPLIARLQAASIPEEKW